MVGQKLPMVEITEREQKLGKAFNEKMWKSRHTTGCLQMLPPAWPFMTILYFQNERNLFVSSLTFNLISRLELKDNLVVTEERLVNNRYGRIRHVQVGPDGLIYF